MSFCSNCGSKCTENDRFCPSCGNNLNSESGMVENQYRNMQRRERSVFTDTIVSSFQYYKELILHSNDATESVFEEENNSIPFVITIFSIIINTLIYTFAIKRFFDWINTKMLSLGGYMYGYDNRIMPEFKFLETFFQGMIFGLILVALLSLGLFIISKVFQGKDINVIKVIAVASVGFTCLNIVAFIVSYVSVTVACIIISISVYAAVGIIFTNTHKYITDGKGAHIAIASIVMISILSVNMCILKGYYKLLMQYASEIFRFFL